MGRLNNTCQTCAFLVLSEASETHFRCGFEPQARSFKPLQPMQSASYRPVKPSDSCGHWQESGSSALSEKFI
jgi:hypothetical protein